MTQYEKEINKAQQEYNKATREARRKMENKTMPFVEQFEKAIRPYQDIMAKEMKKAHHAYDKKLAAIKKKWTGKCEHCGVSNGWSVS